MHTTSDCHQYEKNGKLEKGFGKGQHSSMTPDKKTASAFMQLSTKIAKLEKVNKKLKKVNKKLKKSSKKHKHEYDNDSSESDSS